MIIMRGIPGSGKSTLAKRLMEDIEDLRIDGEGVSVEKYSTDDYWINEDTGKYEFDIKRIGMAHAWNLDRVKVGIGEWDVVIVDNTNIVWRDFKRYVELAINEQYDIMLAEPQTSWRIQVYECFERNTHNVPYETICRMASKYQSNKEIMAETELMMWSMKKEIDIFTYNPLRVFESPNG